MNKEDIYKSVENLKKTIDDNLPLYSQILCTKPMEYESIVELCNIDKTISLRKLSDSIFKMDEVQHLENNILFVGDNEYTDINKDPNDNTQHKKVCIRNTRLSIDTIRMAVDKPKKRKYFFETFCPQYTFFIFNHKSIFEKNITFFKYNDLLELIWETYNMINRYTMLSDPEKSTQQMLFLYLTERGFGFTYKSFLYKYATEFKKELDERKIDKYFSKLLMNDYIWFFSLFRQLYTFYNDEFFSNVHTIVSKTLIARHKDYLYYLPYGIVTNENLKRTYDELNKIIDDLYNYLTSGLTAESQNESQKNSVVDFSEKEIKKFAKSLKITVTRDKQRVSLWNQIQECLNKQIEVDFNENFFGLIPQNIKSMSSPVSSDQMDLLTEMYYLYNKMSSKADLPSPYKDYVTIALSKQREAEIIELRIKRKIIEAIIDRLDDKKHGDDLDVEIEQILLDAKNKISDSLEHVKLLLKNLPNR